MIAEDRWFARCTRAAIRLCVHVPREGGATRYPCAVARTCDSVRAGTDNHAILMMARATLFALLFALTTSACGDKTGTPTPAGGAGPTVPPAAAGATAGAAAQEPKAVIAAQFALLVAGDVDKLKECFTERQKERITADSVAKGKASVGTMTLDDLVGAVEMGEYEGKKTAKVKMKNGRTLTTLILTEGKWLADTVWFK